MKKLSYLFAGLALSFTASSQVQNLDFESWDFPVVFTDPAQNRPTGWICTNRWFGYEEVTFSEKFVQPVDSSAQSDAYALRLFTYYNYMKDAAAQTAAIDYRPTALTGVYKYEDNIIIWGQDYYLDTAQVVVLLTKWNPVLSKNEQIGKGRFSTYQTAASFTSFEVNIAYTSAAQPDSVTILLDPSILGRYPGMDLQNEAHGGRSVFTLDNLSLTAESTMGIAEAEKKALALYPNPAGNQIRFEQVSGDVIITNAVGKVVLHTSIREESFLDISTLSKGMFLLRIWNEKEIYTGKFDKF